MGGNRNASWFWLEIVREEDCLEDQGVDGRAVFIKCPSATIRDIFHMDWPVTRPGPPQWEAGGLSSVTLHDFRSIILKRLLKGESVLNWSGSGEIKWQTVVNAVMNLRVSQSAGIFFLAPWGTVSMSLTVMTAGVTRRCSRYLSQTLNSGPPNKINFEIHRPAVFGMRSVDYTFGTQAWSSWILRQLQYLIIKLDSVLCISCCMFTPSYWNLSIFTHILH